LCWYWRKCSVNSICLFCSVISITPRYQKEHSPRKGTNGNNANEHSNN
jgi:hypothetical protein